MWIQQEETPSQGIRVLIGCNAGSSAVDLRVDSCTPCPLGTYANTTGATVCLSCPALTQTQRAGATSSLECDVCDDHSVCHGHGQCTVTDVLRGNTQCSCNAFYLAADSCETPWVGIILVLLVLLLLLVVGVMRSMKRSRHYVTQYSLTERLLEDRSQQVEELESIWRIRHGDLQDLSLIGSGAMGEVFSGDWIGKRVAVKMLREAVLEADEASLSEFEREMAFLRSVRHANVVFFYGAGVHNGVPFLVTELMSGGSLRDSIRDVERVSLSSEQRLSFARDIARAMEMLHGLKCLHRDLKSDNILIGQTTDGNARVPLIAKVADFGCSTLLASIGGGSAAHKKGSTSKRKARCERSDCTPMGVMWFMATMEAFPMPLGCTVGMSRGSLS